MKRKMLALAAALLVLAQVIFGCGQTTIITQTKILPISGPASTIIQTITLPASTSTQTITVTGTTPTLTQTQTTTATQTATGTSTPTVPPAFKLVLAEMFTGDW